VRHTRQIVSLLVLGALVALVTPVFAGASQTGATSGVPELQVPVRLTVNGAPVGSTIVTTASDVKCATSVGIPVIHTDHNPWRDSFVFVHDRARQCISEESRLDYEFTIKPVGGLKFSAAEVHISQVDRGEPYGFTAKITGCGRATTCSASALKDGHEVGVTINL
jgi:hypothetical protein